MKVLIIIAIVVVCFFLITFGIYWFNLDSKLVKALLPVLDKHYDNMPRDKRL